LKRRQIDIERIRPDTERAEQRDTERKSEGDRVREKRSGGSALCIKPWVIQLSDLYMSPRKNIQKKKETQRKGQRQSEQHN